jgi:hypothetical protein
MLNKYKYRGLKIVSFLHYFISSFIYRNFAADFKK